jgi:hypothetical protein
MKFVFALTCPPTGLAPLSGFGVSQRLQPERESWIIELRGKSVTGGAAFAGVNSSRAKIRNPPETSKTQSAAAVARIPVGIMQLSML